MGGGIEDINRDERRYQGIRDYLESVISFLKGEAIFEEVRQKAEEASGGRHGYWSSPVDLIENLDEIKELKNNNKEIWAKFLYQFLGPDRLLSKSFYDLSPWKDKVIIAMEYGMRSTISLKTYPKGFISENIISKIIHKKDWITYDCDDYLIVLNQLNEQSEVYWIGNDTEYKCGDNKYHCLKMPRKYSDWNCLDGTLGQRNKYCAVE